MPAPVSHQPIVVPQQYVGLFEAAASGTGIPANVIAAQAWVESRFNPKVTSPAGAQGFWQFMPATWKTYGLGSPFNVADAFGAYRGYMAVLLQDFHGNIRNALAAYNAGPGNIQAGMGYANEVLAESQQVTGLPGSPGQPPGTPPPPPPNTRTDTTFLAALKKALGTPYLTGGTHPFQGGADCAGLVFWAAERAGIHPPGHTTWAMWPWVHQFHDPKLLRPGDLVFMTFPGETPPGHVAVWLGGNKVIQDSQPGQPVAIANFNPSTGAAAWGATLNGFGRMPGIGPAPPPGSAGAGVGGGGGLGTGGSSNPSIGAFIGDMLAGLFGGDPQAAGDAFGIASQSTGALGDIGSAITGLVGVFGKMAAIVDWWLNPSHIIRIAAGLGGGVSVIAGVLVMSRVGGGSVGGVEVPNAASLPLGIALVGTGGIMLFIAFHNLPSTVTDFPSLMAWLQSAAHGQASAQEASPPSPVQLLAST